MIARIGFTKVYYGGVTFGTGEKELGSLRVEVFPYRVQFFLNWER